MPRRAQFIAGGGVCLIAAGVAGWLVLKSAWVATSQAHPTVAAQRPLALGEKLRPVKSLADLTFDIDTTERAETTNGSTSEFPAPQSPCEMPPAGRAKVVVFGVYQGQSLSTVALGSRNEVTGFMDVVIEPGPEPLFVVLNAYGRIIWRFSGSLERVQNVVLVEGGSDRGANHRGGMVAERGDGAAYGGVVGLPADVLSSAEKNSCFNLFYKPGSRLDAWVRDTVTRAAGKAPDVVAGHYDLAAVRLPSGLGARARESFPTASSYPAGLTFVDPREVVSQLTPIAYDVLPQEAGLLQLINAGALRSSDRGYKVVRPIARFPAGLTGGHAVNFIIARGVPLPGGDPGHSCVLMEWTNRPPKGQRPGAICNEKDLSGSRFFGLRLD